MHWFFIALGAPFLWALVNIIDQYLVAKYAKGKRGSGGLILFSSFIGIFVAILIGIFTDGLFTIPILDKLLLVLTGAITVVWFILYMFALQIEDVSSVVPWFLTIPIFGYVLGYIFLGETLTTQQLLGSLVVLFGVLLMSINFTGKKRKLIWKPAFYMLVACLLIAITGVIFKYVTITDKYWISSFWEYVGLGGCGILIYIFVPKYRREFTLMNRQGGKKIFALNTTNEVLYTVGTLLTNYAFLLAPVTLVYLVGSFQPAIVLFMTLITTRFFPSIAVENTSNRVLMPKIIAIILMLFGSAILFL